ncbi:MAG: hypothetical protein Q8J69_07670 [Sphingobacteriaceae bacterium]|nr:hypothetical protein [Sphingobacteriaceae bacterium]
MSWIDFKALTEDVQKHLAQRNVGEVSYWFKIKVIQIKGRDIIDGIHWQGLRWELRMKYDWYFKYRAALLQVKYPRAEVQCFWGNQPAEGKTLQHILKTKIQAKRAQITKITNKMEAAKQKWNQLFPIEDEEDWKKATAKLAKLKFELLQLENDANDYVQQ